MASTVDRPSTGLARPGPGDRPPPVIYPGDVTCPVTDGTRNAGSTGNVAAGSIYTSAVGRRVVERCYERGVERLRIDVDDEWVDTRYGETHLLVAGDEAAPPVVVFHGGNATNPLTLAWFEALADDYRLVAPDTIGQPGLSAPTRVDPTGDAYGEWVVDLLDALGLGSVPLVGPSYGAGIALRTAAYAPDRIAAAALVVPAGLTLGSLPRLVVGIGLPTLGYRLTGSRRLLARVLDAICTVPAAELDEVTVDTIGAALRHVELDRAFPTVEPAELADFDAPTSLVAARHDPFFPADRVVPTARGTIPSLVRATVLTRERHFPSPAGLEHVRSEVRRLLDRIDWG